jgi:S-adenosylmethionine decarboxylase
MDALGRHLLVECEGCDPAALADLELITEAMLRAAKKGGATIVTHSFHHFAPGGISGAVIISESHLTLHTWPEHAYAAVDLFTCSPGVDEDKVMAVLQAALRAERMTRTLVLRGPTPVSR